MLVSIGVVAEIFGVSAQTIRNWCEQGFLHVWRTQGGHRHFCLEEVKKVACMEEEKEEKTTIIYSRVSSYDQKTRQGAANGGTEELSDPTKVFGHSGLNFCSLASLLLSHRTSAMLLRRALPGTKISAP